MIRTARVAPHRWAATDPRFPRLVGYGDTPEEATRALEDKLPRAAPGEPRAPALPLAPAHGLSARIVERERREPSHDAMDRAVLVGRIDSNRRRH